MYPPGEPTNIVVSRTRTSRRELDWIPVGLQSPVSACRKALLPGPNTHLVVACEFTVRSVCPPARDTVAGAQAGPLERLAGCVRGQAKSAGRGRDNFPQTRPVQGEGSVGSKVHAPRAPKSKAANDRCDRQSVLAS